jgi:uncharacterized membrane protein YkoI
MNCERKAWCGEMHERPMNGPSGCVHAPFMRLRARSASMVSFPQGRSTLEAPLRRRAAAVFVWALCSGLTIAPLAAGADDDDARRARTAREQRRILPLEQLIGQVSQSIPGRLLEAELDDEDGLLVYELRWQMADGRRLEIELDARDGRWLKLEGPRLETVFKRAAGPGR